VAKSQHPGINGLQSSSSADRTAGGIESNSKISQAALHPRWRDGLNEAAGAARRPLDLYRLPMSNCGP
jgi:hypothetical protein